VLARLLHARHSKGVAAAAAQEYNTQYSHQHLSTHISATAANQEPAQYTYSCTNYHV
jgi:hypothetical protein